MKGFRKALLTDKTAHHLLKQAAKKTHTHTYTGNTHTPELLALARDNPVGIPHIMPCAYLLTPLVVGLRAIWSLKITGSVDVEHLLSVSMSLNKAGSEA